MMRMNQQEKLSTKCKFNSITWLTSLPVADEIEHVESFGKSTFLFHPIESFVQAFIDFLSLLFSLYHAVATSQWTKIIDDFAED